MTPAIPDRLLHVFDSFMSCEFSYVAKSGPVTVPVVSFYKRRDQNFLITSSIAYCSKVEGIAKNPKVSILFSNPSWSGLENPPAVLVQGDAHVDGAQNLSAWRSVMEDQPRNRKVTVLSRKLNTLDSRMRFWPVRALFEYYVLRVTIVVRPRTFRVWDGKPLPQHRRNRGEEEGITPWVITLIDGGGYPFSFPVSTENFVREGKGLQVLSPVEVDFEGRRPCYALSHSHDSNYNHARQKVIRGVMSRDDSGYFLTPVRSYERNLGWSHTLLADHRRASKFLASYRPGSKRS